MPDETTGPSGDTVNPEELPASTDPVDLEEARLSDEELQALIEASEGAIGQALRQVLADGDTAREDRLRALAEVRNNQRRAAENERRVEQAARASVYRSVLPVLDQMEMALDQDLEAISVRQLADGVRIARDELTKVLTDQGVSRIDPGVGDPFDPVRHEAMLRQEAEGIETDHIVMILQPGYAVGERVLRPAKVAVAT